jgi:uncharacterized membrane protein YdjX (TVP38/TMEM64 family)
MSATSSNAGEVSLGSAEASERSTGGSPWRIVIVAVVLLAAVLLIHLTPARQYLTDVNRLRDRLLSLGPAVYPLAVVGTAALLACGVPRLPIHAAGGMIFGFTLGLILTLIGAILGHLGVFLFIRWGGRQWVLTRWPNVRRWADAVHQHGIVAVLLARQLPAHAMLINAALAVSNVRLRDFILGSALGLLPEAICATLVGAGLVKASLKDSAGSMALAAAAMALIWLGGGYALRALRKEST